MSTELTIQKEVSPIVEKAEKLVIKTPKDMEKATQMLSEVNQFGDRIEAEKQKVMRPLLDAQKAERARWKPTETIIERAVLAIRKAMTTYQTAAKKEADEKAAKIAARVDAGTLRAETGMKKLDEIKTPDAAIATAAGMVKFRTVEKFEVMDITLLAKAEGGAFVLANDMLIREKMKEGLKLPGVRYFTEEVPVNSR